MFKTAFPILLAIFASSVALADVVRHGSLPERLDDNRSKSHRR